jgi:hypothetical protein
MQARRLDIGFTTVNEPIQMDNISYLLSYGKAGEFGVFRAASTGCYQRSQNVVVKSRRGVELGWIMREAGETHARLLDGTYLGEILRPAAPDDLEIASRLQQKAEALFERGRRLGSTLQLPIEIFDAEILLDGRNGVLYVLRRSNCDPGPLLDTVSEREQLLVTMHDLGPAPSRSETDDATAFGACGGGSCGEGGCGTCQKGSCSTCKTHHAEELGAVAPRLSLDAEDKGKLKSSPAPGPELAFTSSLASPKAKRISLA